MENERGVNWNRDKADPAIKTFCNFHTSGESDTAPPKIAHLSLEKERKNFKSNKRLQLTRT